MRRRSTSEVSRASDQDRRKNLAAEVARSRYQTFVVDRPKKNHKYCEPVHKGLVEV
jgi:hypothetical protein